MNSEFPPAVPEIPVADVDMAVAYYERCLGFTLDWGGEDGGIAGISKGECRLFLTNSEFRTSFGNAPPMLIWFNLDGRGQVDDLFATWNASGARIVSRPESKPWKLYEFTAADLDGNLMRVFYDFSTDQPGE